MERTTTIYVLRLKAGKYYVGRSDVPESRILAHFKSNGSTWTRKYPPEKVVEVIEGDRFDEDKCTKQYMAKYGIENVRGGTYCEVVLSKVSLSTLQKELATVADACFKCGKSGHFASGCTQRKKVADYKPVKKRARETLTPITFICSRCGRNNHQKDECSADTYLNGKSIPKRNKKQKLDYGAKKKPKPDSSFSDDY